MSANAVTVRSRAGPDLDEGTLRALFDRNPDALLLIDPFGDRIIAANRRAEVLLGYGREELLGLRASSLHRDGLSALVVFTESVLANGSGWTSELGCTRKTGEALSTEHHAVAVPWQGGEAILASLRDLEEVNRRFDKAKANDFVRRGLAEWRRVERLFQDLERENQLILGAAGEGIYGVNARGITTFVNPAAERMLGWPADELVGRNMHAMVHHSHPDGRGYSEDDCPIFAAFRDGAVHRIGNEVFWRKDGTSFYVEYTSTPIREDGRPVGAVIVFRDVSDQKRAEAELRAALDEVEHLKRKLELENEYLQEEIRQDRDHHTIVGRSRAVREVIRQVELVAPTGANVLVTGESGTGKELIAGAIHESSARRDRPLIRVNCAAVPRDLFESEFFGHVKGAFTGAVNHRAGRFELADGGTLFLDEVGEIPLELQGKLLRVLQEGQFERVGEERTRQVDVRVIAATNRDLEAEVDAGRFRRDLFFRLNVFPIESASLRERVEDIPLLAGHFLEKVCRRFGVTGLRLTQADVLRLQGYDWPGNVRELENVIERAVIVSRGGPLRLNLPEREAAGEVGAADPPAGGPDPDFMTEADRRRRDREMIVRALRQTGGRVFGEAGAAELLGVKPTTLASRIKRLGIDKDEARAARQDAELGRHPAP